MRKLRVSEQGKKERVDLRHHPLYFAICVLFAIALEFVILRRIRQHNEGEDEAEKDPPSRIE